MNLSEKIRSIKDFPKEGILFYDITTLLKDPEAFENVVERLHEHFKDKKIDKVIGIESRGFIFGAPLALRLKCGYVPIRKPGKLPAAKASEEYDLEYGKDRVEIHVDALNKGERVVVVDDLLATGGTAAAAGRLVEKIGGVVVSFAFMIELDFLKGREKLGGKDVYTLVHF